jgi:hypothetical protein
LRTRLGSGLSGTVLDLIVPTANRFQRRQCDIKNRNANNAQMAPRLARVADFGTSAGTMANAGKTITLESYIVELAHGP